MEGRLLLKNCSVLSSGGQVTRAQAVLIEGSQVTRVEPDAAIPSRPGDWVVACEGRVVMPGLVDCHSDLLSSLVDRGSPTAGEVAAISAHALALGLRAGVTTHLELLHAPHDIRGILGAQRAVAEKLGARLMQSHSSVTRAELDANAEAIAGQPGGIVKTGLGLWSSARCDDACLTHASQRRGQLECAVHLRFAESEEDLAVTYTRFGKQVAARLDGFGLLTPRTLGAFARALDGSGAQLAARRGMLVAPWVDATHVGGFEAMLASGLALGPSTAGQRRVWEAVSAVAGAAGTVERAGRVKRSAQSPWEVLFDGPARFSASVFGGKFGAVAPGHTADLIVLDAVEAGSSIAWARLASAPVAWTVVDGRVVVREGQLLGADFLELGNEAAKAVDAVWARA